MLGLESAPAMMSHAQTRANSFLITSFYVCLINLMSNVTHLPSNYQKHTPQRSSVVPVSEHNSKLHNLSENKNKMTRGARICVYYCLTPIGDSMRDLISTVPVQSPWRDVAVTSVRHTCRKLGLQRPSPGIIHNQDSSRLWEHALIAWSPTSLDCWQWQYAEATSASPMRDAVEYVVGHRWRLQGVSRLSLRHLYES